MTEKEMAEKETILPLAAGMGLLLVLLGVGVSLTVVAPTAQSKTPTATTAQASASSAPKPASSVPEKKEPPPPPPTPAVGEEVSEEYFRYLERKVGFDCQQQIKALVKYDIRSPGTFYGTNSGDWAILRFDRWSGRVASDGAIRVFGDHAEAQNGFGNWMRVNYSCTVNVASMRIVNAALNSGKL